MIRRLSLAALLLAFAAPVVAQTAPANVADGVVITARPLADTEQALKDCIARNCPPDEDIAATLAHADNQFLAGDYDDARATLRRSIGRNKRAAKNYPIPTSELYRGAATVDLHMGERDSYLRNTVEIRDSLKAGLSDTDPRVLVAQLGVGDMRLRLGYPDEAERYYDDVAEEADRLGQPLVADIARIRKGWMFASLADGSTGNPTSYRQRARALAEEVLVRAADRDPRVRLAALTLLHRIDEKEGRADHLDALLAAARSQTSADGERPRLVLADPLVDDGAFASAVRASRGGSVTNRLSTVGAGDWVDIGFWVRSNGRVEDISVLRKSGQADWLKPVLKQLQSRVYTRTDADPGDSGYFMVERYTLTADYADLSSTTGTRVRQRSPLPRIEKLDLTTEPAPVPAPAPTAS